MKPIDGWCQACKEMVSVVDYEIKTKPDGNQTMVGKCPKDGQQVVKSLGVNAVKAPKKKTPQKPAKKNVKVKKPAPKTPSPEKVRQRAATGTTRFYCMRCKHGVSAEITRTEGRRAWGVCPDCDKPISKGVKA